jgi:hypothetical protein
MPLENIMDIGIKFPTVTEKVLAERDRCRGMSQFERNAEVEELFGLYHELVRDSGRADHLTRVAEAEETKTRNAIFALAARHAPQ